MPQGIPAGVYLAAVVQERQAREIRRAHANGAGAYPSPTTARTTAPTPAPPVGYFSAVAQPEPGAARPAEAAEGPAQAPASGARRDEQPTGTETSRPPTGFVPPA
ncbi:hypothetical protein GCM10020295_50740 [Streptomyces cinereospinus]